MFQFMHSQTCRQVTRTNCHWTVCCILVLDQRKTCTVPWKDSEEKEGHAPALSICMLLGLQGAVPCDLHFYDELANQEEPIRLSIRKDPKGGWTAKVREEVLNLGHGYSTH